MYLLHINLFEVLKEFENLYQEIHSFLDHSQQIEFTGKHILLNLYGEYKLSYTHFRKHDVTSLSKEEKNLALDSLCKDKFIMVSKPD